MDNERKRPPTCPIRRFCLVHNYTHGKEAEELRAGVEELLEKYSSGNAHHYDLEDLLAGLQELLETVDARDSLAYIEAKKNDCPADPPAKPHRRRATKKKRKKT